MTCKNRLKLHRIMNKDYGEFLRLIQSEVVRDVIVACDHGKRYIVARNVFDEEAFRPNLP